MSTQHRNHDGDYADLMECHEALLEATEEVWDSVPACRCREGNECEQEKRHARALNNLFTFIFQVTPAE